MQLAKRPSRRLAIQSTRAQGAQEGLRSSKNPFFERDSEDVVDKVSVSSGSFAVRFGVFDSPGSVRSEQ